MRNSRELPVHEEAAHWHCPSQYVAILPDPVQLAYMGNPGRANLVHWDDIQHRCIARSNSWPRGLLCDRAGRHNGVCPVGRFHLERIRSRSSSFSQAYSCYVRFLFDWARVDRRSPHGDTLTYEETNCRCWQH